MFIVLIPLTRPSVMLGPAGSGRPRRPAKAPRRQRRGNEPPGAPCRRSLHLDATRTRRRRPATARPAGRIGPDPVAGGPTRTHVRLGRLRESGMGGGCSESNHLPSQNTSDQRARQLPPCSRRERVPDWAGVMSCGGEGTR